MKPTDALPHPSDWQESSIGRAIEIKRGISWSKEQEHTTPRDGAVPVIRIGNVQSTLELDDMLYISGLKPKAVEKKRVGAGWSILVGSNGNRARIGNAVLIREKVNFLFASFLLGARPVKDAGFSSEWFFRWLGTERVQAYLTASAEGSTGLSNLSHSFFRSLTIAFPPTDAEQAAIARILDAVDTAIERTRSAVDNALGLKRAVLRRFFYDALGETAYANRPYKTLPDGWKLMPTGELLAEEPKNGVSPKASSQPPGVPTFSIAAVRNGRVDLSGEHLKYARLSEKVARKFQVARGDLLVVRGNANPDLVGKAGMISDFPEGCIYPDITKRVVFKTEGEHTITPDYAVLAWNHPIVHNQIVRRAKTSNGTLKINTRDVKQIILPVPPKQAQKDLVVLVAAVEAKADALKAKLVALEELKKSLMHDLLTGRVRVPTKI